MTDKTIFRETEELYEHLNQALQKIHNEEGDLLRISERSLMAVDQSVRALKSLVKKYGFGCLADEIHFFKDLKPLFISKFIYHSQKLKIISESPVVGEQALKEYYNNERHKLLVYFTENAEFYSYYRRGAVYLDYKYFVRNAYDLKMKLPSALYNYDEAFTTSHDHHIAYFLANHDLEKFLKDEIEDLENPTKYKTNKSLLSWSSSKVALVELIYALHLMRCCNGGNIELSEIIRGFEKMFQMDLGNFHKILNEISLRKTGRTKFLRLLEENLEQHFTDMDGK